MLSQKHEGWSALPTRYDDGGFSGGSMERPALTALLADVSAGRIDVVVVYKVDRLTRALADFARIVAIFDARAVSFVSVTQAFNTTTSMGRLTLNVLMSFAQFEREVTAERIRDKIAASKRKGMWMGGQVPFGYRVEGRRLVPHAGEAGQVRAIFTRYLELGTVPKLQVALERDGERAPVRTSVSGKRSGGAILSRGALYALLTNPLLIGRIRHRDEIHSGRHPAIIGMDLWGPGPGTVGGEPGRALGPSDRRCHRYRYYVSRDLIERWVEAGAKGWRIPAEEIKGAVAQAIVDRLEDPAFVSKALDADAGSQTIRVLRGIAAELRSPEPAIARAALRRITRRIDLGEDRLRAMIELAGATSEGDVLIGIPPQAIDTPITIFRRGKQLRLIITSSSGAGVPDAALIRLIIQARQWIAAWRDTDVPASLSDIAEAHGVDVGDVSRAVQLAFLAPDLVETILDGCQPANLTVTTLKRIGDLPLLWSEQVSALS